MPIRKFRSVEELNQPRFAASGPEAWRAMAELAELGERTVRPRFPPGVHKHRDIAAAEELRQTWEDANVRRHQARLAGERRAAGDRLDPHTAPMQLWHLLVDGGPRTAVEALVRDGLLRAVLDSNGAALLYWQRCGCPLTTDELGLALDDPALNRAADDLLFSISSMVDRADPRRRNLDGIREVATMLLARPTPDLHVDTVGKLVEALPPDDPLRAQAKARLTASVRTAFGG